MNPLNHACPERRYSATNQKRFKAEHVFQQRHQLVAVAMPLVAQITTTAPAAHHLCSQQGAKRESYGILNRNAPSLAITSNSPTTAASLASPSAVNRQGWRGSFRTSGSMRTRSSKLAIAPCNVLLPRITPKNSLISRANAYPYLRPEAKLAIIFRLAYFARPKRRTAQARLVNPKS